ncbi:MAG: magnesium transporter [Verrucomicrobiae bacterium]|nr:magnesium transporter [Verrucomicrobiae bacterium]
MDQPILELARKDFTALPRHLTADQALDNIRRHGIGERVVYFYVTEEDGRLAGVLPTRRLLTAEGSKPLSELMIPKVAALPSTATVAEACEAFALHKFLAFPVVDADRRLVGMVDVSLFTDEVFDLAEREQLDAMFEAIGIRAGAMNSSTSWLAFQYRFPWLLATIASGTLCALLAGRFEMTLSKSLVLAFFMTLVLGLGEGVAMQSMTVTIQALRATRPSWKWFGGAVRRELGTAVLLGLACGISVALVAWIWRGELQAAGVIGASIALALLGASFFGLGVPTILHALKLDPKIAAGPVSLALADLGTLTVYFNLARWLL